MEKKSLAALLVIGSALAAAPQDAARKPGERYSANEKAIPAGASVATFSIG